MSQAAAPTANIAPATSPSTQLQSSNYALPRSPASSVYSTASTLAAAPSTPLPGTPNPPSGTVALAIRELYLNSRFAYEFVQKLHRRQLLFFWRKKKAGLPALRVSLKSNIKYFATYDAIAVEAPGLALRIGEVDEEFGRQVSAVLALAHGTRRTLQYDSLAHSSEVCRAQVEGLLQEAREANGRVREVAVVPETVMDEAALPKTEPEAAVLENAAGSSSTATPTVREVKVPNELFVPKRRTPQAQNMDLVDVAEEAQGRDAGLAT